MRRATLFLAVACLAVAAPMAWAQPTPTVIEIPMDEQINIGGTPTADSPNGDAIYVPTWNTIDYLEFRDDEAEGYCRLWIGDDDPNDPGTGPGYYYGPYIDFILAGYDPLDCVGFGSSLEFDCRYYQDPNINGDPYSDAPIGVRLYTYDDPNDAYLGHVSYDFPYQTGPGNLCDPKPVGFPEWWHVTVDINDFTADFWCDGSADVHPGGDWDLTHVSRLRFWGTDWWGDYWGPVNDWIDVKNVKFTLYPPACVGDITGDGNTALDDLNQLLQHYGCLPHDPVAVYSTNGFEAYSLGALPGQDGWVEDTTDPDLYGVVEVVDDPTGSGMGKVIEFTPDDPVVGGWLGVERPIDPGVTAQYAVIAFDQWRDALNDNVWMADAVAFDGWWGMEWDQNHRISSYIYDFGAELTAGQWQHVVYILDLVNDTATVIVDGEMYTGPTAMPDDSIDGIVFELEPTEHEGAGEILYVDNVVIGTAPNLEYIIGCEPEDGDYDGDRDVDLADLNFLLQDYGCVWE
jgi:hypothetical protein